MEKAMYGSLDDQNKIKQEVCFEETKNDDDEEGDDIVKIVEVFDGRHEIGTDSAVEIQTMDGGYSWIVCFCAFVHLLIADGQVYSFGVLYVAFLERYQSAKGVTSLVGAVLMGVSMIVGPLAAATVTKFSLRTAAILGSLMAALGQILSAFAPNIIVLTFTYGILTGAGLGFLFLTSILACNAYFNKRRALANGLAMIGPGVGIFALPQILVLTLDSYGLFGTWFILAGISLNGCIAGAMYRTPPITAHQLQRIDETIDTAIVQNWEVEEKLDEIYSDEAANTDELLLTPAVSSHAIVKSIKNSQNLNQRRKNMLNVSANSLHESCWTLKGKELSHIDLCQIGRMHTTSSIYELNVHERTVPNNSIINHTTKDRKGQRNQLCKRIFTSMNCHLLRSPTLLLLILSAMLWTAQLTLHTFYIEFAESCGIDDSKAALLVSVTGITSCIGRIPIGFITDSPRVSGLLVYMLGIGLGGALLVIMPFITSYEPLLLLATLFGPAMSAFCSLRAIVIVETLGVENLAGSLGLMVMFQGLAYTIVPPMAGAILETTQSFKVPFIASGLCLFLSAATLFPIFFRCIKIPLPNNDV